MISETVRLIHPDQTTVVVKSCPSAPAGLFAAEADGLALLERSGTVAVPAVLEVHDQFLVLCDLGASAPGRQDWERLGAEVAQLHSITGEHFGLTADNYLGRLRQDNRPARDGHEFFAERRLLRYLDEPRVAGALEPEDRGRLERLAARLPSLVPVQPPSLLHGDLWYANVVGAPRSGGRPALVDPACHYGWAEAELSMLWCSGRVPSAFWDAYLEIRPLHDGWQERMALLHLREHLSVLAHFGDAYATTRRVRAVLDRY